MNQYRGKKVVITGGAGFIGSHLVEHMVQQGAHVTVFDNLRTGSLENLSLVKQNITFVQEDIRSLETCLTVTKDASFVFHTAAQISVQESMQNPMECHDINVTGTRTILEAARLNHVSRFIFSSSCAVYGEQLTACSEINTFCKPTSVYAFSKLLGEQLCKEYSTLFSLPTLCLRYFNVFGPRQNPHGTYAGVIAKFQNNLSANKQVTIFGNGLQTRDFVPVEKVVKANCILAQLPTSECQGNPINIATGKSKTLLEMFFELKKIYPTYNHTPIFAPARFGDILHSQADCNQYDNLIKKYHTIAG